MGEVLDWPIRQSALEGAPTIDPLTAEVAIAIWRLGGVANGEAIADAVAFGRGRWDGFSPAERAALRRAIFGSVEARAQMRHEPLLCAVANGEDHCWALTPVARAVLGDRP